MNVVKRKVFFQAYNTHDQFETVVLYLDSLVEFRSYIFGQFFVVVLLLYSDIIHGHWLCCLWIGVLIYNHTIQFSHFAYSLNYDAIREKHKQSLGIASTD